MTNKKKRNDDDDTVIINPKKSKKNKSDTPPPSQTPPPEPVRILFPFVFHARPGHRDDDDEDGEDEDDRSFKSKIKKLKVRIIASGMEEKVKKMALTRLKTVNEFNACKELEWFEMLLKIPFGKYSKLPVGTGDSQEKIEEFFENAQKNLDNAVYGMDKVKEEIINYIAQFISTNGESMPRIIGLVGHPGLGKTAIIRRGLSESLKRPMKCISMGGIRDSSHFVGFDFTYSGSKCGCIVQTLSELGVMNPIIFMDELDKISFTNDGLDVQNLLVHLTDPVQNNTFVDKYFSGIELDLSKAIFIFSFNDEKLVSPILKDRLHIIEVPTPTEKEKIIIGKKHLLKELCPNIGMTFENINFEDEVMRYIIQQHCKDDKGVRGLKRCIETILLKINTARFLGRLNKYKTLKVINFPITITKEMVDELVEKNKNDKDEFIRHMFL